jgi:hypothetical protein
MREILPLLEAAPYVFRYAWFASRWMVAGVYVDKSASLLKPYSNGEKIEFASPLSAKKKSGAHVKLYFTKSILINVTV